MSYIAWLVIGVGCGIIELLTMGFWFLWLALSALLVSLLTGMNIVTTLPAQIAAFGLITLVFIVFTRPLVMKLFKSNDVKSNVDALIGMSGTVSLEIVPPHTGQVNLQGQIWTARSEELLPEGTPIQVISVEGVTLSVEGKKE